jgi:hypothetical protein
MMEKRQAIRYPIEKLPESLKIFMVDILEGAVFVSDVLKGATIEVNVVDASSFGIGIIAPVPATTFSVNQYIVLHSIQEDFRLVGQVRYILAENDRSCHVGVEFKQSKSLNTYTYLLANVEGYK